LCTPSSASWRLADGWRETEIPRRCALKTADKGGAPKKKAAKKKKKK
jgi:hypothetical protein